MTTVFITNVGDSTANQDDIKLLLTPPKHDHHHFWHFWSQFSFTVLSGISRASGGDLDSSHSSSFLASLLPFPTCGGSAEFLTYQTEQTYSYGQRL